jgi:hypothetical protein
VKLGINQTEAHLLSKKHPNIYSAYQNSSLSLERNEEIKLDREQKANPINQEIELSKEKQIMKQQLIELGVESDQIDFLVSICDTVEEAMANINGEALINNIFIPTNQKFKHGEYEYTDKNMHVDEKCSICLELYVIKDIIKMLPCTHRFHRDCINPWFKEVKKQCPECNTAVKYT